MTLRRAMALLALPLAGCMAPASPRPEAAAVAPPGQWLNGLPGHGTIDPRWWQAFGDPAMTRLVEAAIANNPDIAIAVARVREARAQETLARAAVPHARR